jgi:hypothetical protein
MEKNMASGKYNNRAFVSNAPGAFYRIAASDFGVATPAAATLVLETGSGSLGTGTTSVKIAWVTNEGVGLPGAIASLATPTNTDAIEVEIPSLPALPNNGTQEVIGWVLYSANSTSLPAVGLLAQNTTGTTPAPVSISTQQGTVTGFLVATTEVLLTAKGAGPAVAAYDATGIQPPLPSLVQDASIDYYAIVPNSGSQWKQQKNVQYMNPDGINETLGIILHQLDFIQPVYPGAADEPQGGSNPPSSTYTQASVANGTWMVMNGYLFQAVQANTTSTAATFIGFSAFNLSKGSTTTDGNVTWLAYGKAGLARFQFSNVSSTTQSPAQRDYELFQL